VIARALGAGSGAVLLALAVLLSAAADAVPPGPAPAAPAAVTPVAQPEPAPAAPAAPTRIVVPALGLDSALIPLGTGPAGELQPPESPDVAGWFAGGAVPGQPGPAVVAGHVDSHSGPGVFFRLAELRPGDRIDVLSPDGPAAFRVSWTEAIAKTEFPTDRVYGPTPVPELRLVTCGGTFDRGTGHYRGNVIVHAELLRN
jgi:sortase (surface protein transpeptidase)